MRRYFMLGGCLLACSSATPHASEPVARIPAAPLVAPERVVDLDAAKQRLACGAELIGFGVDDFEIAARDRSGQIYAFTLEMNDEDGAASLRGNPLARIAAVGRRGE
jgi:hypothetical protein